MRVDDHKMQVLLSATVLRDRPADGMLMARRGAWLRTLLLVVIGCAALVIGSLVYLADRTFSRAWLMPDIVAFGGGTLFGTVGQWLPSFVHPLAFSLFTAAILKPGAAARWGACTFWCAVDVAFEIGQHPGFKAYWQEALQGSAVDWAICRWVLNYELNGTFDPRDIGAAVIGAMAAVLLIQLADLIQETPHAQA
jgi:hypothetical protein